MQRKITLPPIGMRIVKSSAAIAVCYVISFLRGNSGIVFYSQLAALWCMQVYVSETKKKAVQRMIGTVIGAVYGLVFLLFIWGNNHGLNALAVSFSVILILYTTVLLKKKEASYFSCVVFLSIVVNHAADSNPYLFVWNRFLDTVIGILVGVGINCFSLPKRKQKEILFLSGLDDTLLQENNNLSDFSRIELNRMLDEGANFTISTGRTPASLIEPMKGIRLRLPVIAMDGAVLYDIRENRYLKMYVISDEMSQRILAMIRQSGLQCFINTIIDDSFVIFYQESIDPVHQTLVKEMRKSPYRIYLKSEHLKAGHVVYFMLLYPRGQMECFYEKMRESGLLGRLKVLLYDSTDYPGYAYLKIYNKNATREHMQEYLMDMLKLEKTVTFGSIPGKYDILVSPGDSNRVVRELRRRYEPIFRT